MTKLILPMRLTVLMMISTVALWSQAVPDTQVPKTAQNPTAIQYAQTITEADLKDYLNILASDALEGRETGTRGQKMAAAFIAQHFRENGLLPVVPTSNGNQYEQVFPLFKSYYKEVYLEAAGKRYQQMEELLFFGDVAINQPREVWFQFVGQGEESDYNGLNVENKIVAFFAQSREDRGRKIKLAQDRGAFGFFVINTADQFAFEAYRNQYGHFFNQSSISAKSDEEGDLVMFFGPPEVVADLLDTSTEKLNKVAQQTGKKNALAKVKSKSILIKANKVSETFQTENVLGYVEGSDKKDEVIVVTAHYDHEGIDGESIYNGADDDGSGTAAVMEMAQAFAIAKAEGNGPRRSLLFMTVTAEEKGLLGSAYYADNPVFALDKTIANLNIDMIGRVDPDHQDGEPYVYVIGSDRLSQELHDINERANQTYTQLQLDYKYNDPDDPNRFYYRSDHYNFAKHNIPIIFYFNGTHDDYHQPSDTIEKIRFDLLKQRTDLVFFTAWELANREERVKLN